MIDVAIAFDTDFEPRYGEAIDISPLLRRVVANNPSKYTFHGTGTYVIGRGSVAIVDPGPDNDAHVDALLHAVRGESVSHILITHTHADHSPASRAVAESTGATVLAFGPHPSEATGEGDDQKGVDAGFEPDTTLDHGDIVEGEGWTVEALHTPGHISNHLCFALAEEKAVLTGDHVMGWSTTVIPPPDGNIAAYLRSLELLLDRDEQILYPTHGGPRRDAHHYVRALLDHRLDRERQIVDQLALGPRSAGEIVKVLYADVREELHKPAARSVVAHLRKLHDEERVTTDADRADALDDDTRWRLS